MSGVDIPFAIVPSKMVLDVSDRALRTYVVLAEMVNQDTMTCFPSYQTIAKRAGWSSRRPAVEAVRELEELGWIDVRQRFTEPGRQTSNEYFLYRCKREGARTNTSEGEGARTGTPPGAPAWTLPVHERSHEQDPINQTELNHTHRGRVNALEVLEGKAVEVVDAELLTEEDYVFEQFWSGVLHKTARTKCRDLFSKAVRRPDVTPQLLIDSYTSQADAHVRSGSEKRFFPRPATWLKQERWEDEIADHTSSAQQTMKTRAEVIQDFLAAEPKEHEHA